MPGVLGWLWGPAPDDWATDGGLEILIFDF